MSEIDTPTKVLLSAPKFLGLESELEAYSTSEEVPKPSLTVDLDYTILSLSQVLSIDKELSVLRSMLKQLLSSSMLTPTQYNLMSVLKILIKLLPSQSKSLTLDKPQAQFLGTVSNNGLMEVTEPILSLLSPA